MLVSEAGAPASHYMTQEVHRLQLLLPCTAVPADHACPHVHAEDHSTHNTFISSCTHSLSSCSSCASALQHVHFTLSPIDSSDKGPQHGKASRTVRACKLTIQSLINLPVKSAADG